MVSAASYPTTAWGATPYPSCTSESGVTATLRLVRYSETYLKKSWDWLQDPETKALTMTPDFARDDQRRFFDKLADRRDYRIWGVELTGEGPIGAAGLKHIDGKSAEYWGYIGEKAHWGRGLGKQMLSAIEKQASREWKKICKLAKIWHTHCTVKVIRDKVVPATCPFCRCWQSHS